jgi:hypothetical protein
MFPVKHAWRRAVIAVLRGAGGSLASNARPGDGERVRRRWLVGLLLVVSLTSCGYRAEYGGAGPEERLTVTAAPALVARPEAVQATLAGLRHELSAAGVLRPGAGYPRVVVEVLRVDELSAGIARQETAGGPVPLARGSAIGVVARAWVQERAGGPPARDTGDMRRVRAYATGGEAEIEAERHSAAIRAAARELGQALGRRLLGHPEPASEPM